MALAHPPSTAAVAGHPLHTMLAAFPIACFTLTLMTDIAYWRTSHLLWQHYSEWLLFAGLVFGVLAALAGAVNFVFRREVRALGPGWPAAIGNTVVLILAFINSLVHAGDGWTAVVPWGIVLSIVTVLLLPFTGWLGGSMGYRYRVGTRDLRSVGVSRHE